MLRALSRKDEREPSARTDRSGVRCARVLERGDRAVDVAADNRSAMRLRAPSRRERERDIAERALQALAQVGCDAFREARERSRRASGEDQQLVLSRRTRRFVRRRLLEDRVCVGAADAERADGGTPRRAGAVPVGQAVLDAKRAVREIDHRIRRREVQRRRNAAALDAKRRFDEARDAGRSVQMANVALDRADRAEIAPLRPSERLAQCCDLDRVAERRGRAVRLDVADRLGRDAGEHERGRDDGRLPLDARCGVSDLQRAVVVDRRAEYDGAHTVPIALRVAQALQHDDTDAAARDGTLRLGIEGPAMTVGRQDAALLVEVADVLRQPDRDAARECEVGF